MKIFPDNFFFGDNNVVFPVGEGIVMKPADLLQKPFNPITDDRFTDFFTDGKTKPFFPVPFPVDVKDQAAVGGGGAPGVNSPEIPVFFNNFNGIHPKISQLEKATWRAALRG